MIEIITTSNGEKAMELSDRIVSLVNEYSESLTGFEVIGVLDAVKTETHMSLMEKEE